MRALRAAVALGLLAVGCDRPGPRLSTDEANRVPIFLISPGGTDAACSADQAIAVDVALPRRQPALEGALAALLSRRDPFDPVSGLAHPLYASRLTLRSIERRGRGAAIHLDGYLELGGRCTAERVRAQLERTAGQFKDLDAIAIDVGGRPLPELLAEPATAAR